MESQNNLCIYSNLVALVHELLYLECGIIARWFWSPKKYFHI